MRCLEIDVSMKSNHYFKFEEVQVYQKTMDLEEVVHALVKDIQNHEIYALSFQFRSISDSLAINIAEGSNNSGANFKSYFKNGLG